MNNKETKDQDNVVNLFPSQDKLKLEIGRTLSREFLLRNMHPVHPASVLAIFFRFLPMNGIKFIGSDNQVCQHEQIRNLERCISMKLLRLYTTFTQTPSPGDITTDIFNELKKHNIRVMAPKQFKVVCTLH